jgi:hypothetical protein
MPRLLAFLQTDCPTCRLIVPYLNAFAKAAVPLTGISQDAAPETQQFASQTSARFPIELDPALERSRHFDLVTVPSLVLLDDSDQVIRIEPGFDKQAVNEIAAFFGKPPVATPFDGFPASKPGCSSRHLEILNEDEAAPALNLHAQQGAPALELNLADDEDPVEYCFRTFHDALPVVPPTRERIDRVLAATPLHPLEIIGRIPPCYGEATVEKVAANAVMAGCKPEMMRVLIPLVRALCDERFNAHGVQATTQFAAPLIVVNGPIRKELGFNSRQNLFSNTSRTNSTVGRALQLILLNLGGARPDTIDMSALGNAGKFSFCIAENEEESPWEPLHVELGFKPEESTVSLFAAGSPHGISEQTARTAIGVLKTITYSLATTWSYRSCRAFEVFLILAPEHVKTIQRDGWTKQEVRQFLFDNTGVPLRCYDDEDPGEGYQARHTYEEIKIDGEPCYRKFNTADSIKIIVAGGTAGKFSAMLQSWATGPRGSQMVTYPVP